jgi:uncharacterized membrane protein YdjX (TVP38/TMEM64 family)
LNRQSPAAVKGVMVDHGRPEQEGRGRSRYAQPALLVAGLVALPAALVLTGGPSQGELQRTVHDTGLLAPLAFVAAYIVWTVLLFPGVVPTLVGGAVFGFALGSLLALTGAIAGATAAFFVARRVGRAGARDLAGPRGAGLDQWLQRHGFVALLYARLVPIVPFNVLNYAAGVAGISTRAYVSATAVGIVPGTLAYTSLGSASASRTRRRVVSYG